MESYRVIRCEKGLCQDGDHQLIQEEPLLIRVDDKPYSVVMRTPGEEIAHAAGFCLGEGLVDDRNDFAAIGFAGILTRMSWRSDSNPKDGKRSLKFLSEGVL